MALRSYSGAPPPGHLLSARPGEDKEPGFAHGLRFNKLSPGFKGCRCDVPVRELYPLHVHVCAYVCVGHCSNSGGAETCFQLKAEAPTTKTLAGGVVTRRISFFFGPSDLPFLCFTSKALLAGRNPRLCISEGKKERCPLPLLTSLPPIQRSECMLYAKERTKKNACMPVLLAMTDIRSMGCAGSHTSLSAWL